MITFSCIAYLGKAKPSEGGGSSAVTSVNGQTGAVVLTATNINSTAGSNITATTTQGAIGQIDAFITTFENDASVLKTTTTLSSTIDNTTTVALSDLSAYQLDGRPSHKQAGALVVSGNVIGMIDSIDSTNAVVTTIFVSTGTTYTAGSNIQISASNVISATDTTYTAGTGIAISASNEVSTSGIFEIIDYTA